MVAQAASVLMLTDLLHIGQTGMSVRLRYFRGTEKAASSTST